MSVLSAAQLAELQKSGANIDQIARLIEEQVRAEQVAKNGPAKPFRIGVDRYEGWPTVRIQGAFKPTGLGFTKLEHFLENAAAVKAIIAEHKAGKITDGVAYEARETPDGVELIPTSDKLVVPKRGRK